jgi:hypothetical protein
MIKWRSLLEGTGAGKASQKCRHMACFLRGEQVVSDGDIVSGPL